MLKHVIFDMDGTLYDTSCASLMAKRKTVREALGYEIDEDALMRNFGLPDDTAFKELGVHDPIERKRVIDLYLFHFEQLSHTNSIFEGIETLLTTLAQKKIKTGIVTSRMKSQLEDPLSAKLLTYMENAITCDQVRFLKPHAEPMELYLKQAGVAKAEVLYIGDTAVDAQCAQNAGVDFALALWGTRCKELEAKYKPEQPMDLIEMLGL